MYDTDNTPPSSQGRHQSAAVGGIPRLSLTGDATAPRSTRIFPDELTAFCVEAMRRSGMSEAHARTTVAALVTTDTWGVFTHGTRSLRQYLVRVRAGGWRADREPEVAREAPSWAVADGRAVVGMVSACYGMEVAVRKAGHTGIDFVTVRDGSHFGSAASRFVEVVRRAREARP